MVLPIMIAITVGFVGMMLELRADNELQTAVDLAAQASIVPPLGDSSDSQADALYAFSHTLNPSGSENGYLDVTTPLTCTGGYLSGQIDLTGRGYPEPVTCTAGADLDFSHSPISLLWFWSIQLTATAHAYPTAYRQCAPLAGAPAPSGSGASSGSAC